MDATSTFNPGAPRVVRGTTRFLIPSLLATLVATSISAQVVPPPRERADAFLAKSHFRPLPIPVASDKGDIILSSGIELRYRFVENGPGSRNDLRRQLQSVAFVDRFVSGEQKRPELQSIMSSFEIVWSGSTSDYLSDQRAELDQQIEALLREFAPRIRRVAQDDLAVLLRLSLGDFRWLRRSTTGRIRRSTIQNRGVLRHQHQECLNAIGRSVRQQTSQFYASSFEDLERLQLEAIRGCRRDAPLDSFNARLASAEKTVGEIRGRVLFDLVASIGVPTETLEASVDRAETHCAAIEGAALEELDALESKFRESLQKRHHGYAKDLAGVLEFRTSGPPTTDELLVLRSRVGGILRNAGTALVNDLRSEWHDELQAVEKRFEQELASQRLGLLKTFRFERQSIDESVSSEVKKAETEVTNIVTVAQRDFRSFANEFAYCGRRSSAAPFDDLRPATMYQAVGYELESDLRLSFAQRWLDERGDDLDRQFRLILLVHRFVDHDDVGAEKFRRLVLDFNSLWTSSRVTDRAYRRFDQEFRVLLAQATPALREASMIGLESITTNLRVMWRRALQAELAKLRLTANQVADEKIESSEDVVRAQQVVAQECGRLAELHEMALGELEVAFFDVAEPSEIGLAKADTSEPSERQRRFHAASAKLTDLIDRAISGFRRQGTGRYTASRLAIEASAQQTRVELDRAISDLAEFDQRVLERLDAARVRVSEELDQLWATESKRSVYQFSELVHEIRRVYAEVSRGMQTKTIIRDLKLRAAEHRKTLTHGTREPEPRSLEETMRSRRTEIQVELRHLLRDAKRHFAADR